MSVSIYLPGAGMVNLAARRVVQAVRDYDERLLFGRNEETGLWTVFIKMDTAYPGDTMEIGGYKVLPILAFQGSDPPHPDDVTKALWERDALRRGEEILDDINRRNKDIQNRYEQAASDGAGIAAEAFEWGFRKQGAHPSPRIFVPGKEG